MPIIDIYCEPKALSRLASVEICRELSDQLSIPQDWVWIFSHDLIRESSIHPHWNEDQEYNKNLPPVVFFTCSNRYSTAQVQVSLRAIQAAIVKYTHVLPEQVYVAARRINHEEVLVRGELLSLQK